MKKKFLLILSILTAVLLSIELAYADTYYSYVRPQSIPRVRISIDTEALSAGEYLHESALNVISIAENDYYEIMDAYWMDDIEYLKPGDTPRIRVYLAAIPKETDYERYTKIWLFQGGYTSNNVSVSKGSFESAYIRDSGYSLEVNIKVNPVKGQFAEPDTVYWTGSTGSVHWDTPMYGGSGVYDVLCQRNGSTVKKLSGYTGNDYNFYPYMTKEGDYTVKVRSAVPASMNGTGAKASEYVESSDLYITKEQVSDGSGQTNDNGSGNGNYPNGTGNENVAGWITQNGGTYFRYPDGTSAGKGWLKLNGCWYFLDKNGMRLSGWQQDTNTGLWYYMDKESGIMKTGWLKDNGYWYYLENNAGSTEGHMITGWRNVGGYLYYFNRSGIMVTGWYEIDGKWYYFYPEQGAVNGKYGYMASNTQIGDFRIGADGTWQN